MSPLPPKLATIVADVLRGEPGTEVSLTTERPATGEFRDLKLTRAVLKVDKNKNPSTL